MKLRKGALPKQIIEQLIMAEFIQNAELKNVKPASLDLSISDEIYLVKGVFLPRPEEEAYQAFKNLIIHKHNLAEPLAANKTYLARLSEKLNLPSSVYAYANPKSTSGRNNIQARLIADGVARYDSLPAGFSGDLWIVITPKSFPVLLSPGNTLNQLRFFTGDTRFDAFELEIAYKQFSLLFDKQKKFLAYEDLKINDYDGSLILTIDLKTELIGWKAINTLQVLDFSKINYYEPSGFFEPLYPLKNNQMVLKQNEFYVLSTKERLRVPPDLAAEMAAVDERS
mgnify:CR=1 FL=1